MKMTVEGFGIQFPRPYRTRQNRPALLCLSAVPLYISRRLSYGIIQYFFKPFPKLS